MPKTQSTKNKNSRQSEAAVHRQEKSVKRSGNPSPNRNTRIKDIVMLVVFAVCILAIIALFTETIPWMKDGMYFLFGILMYAVPFIVPVLFIIFMYHKKSPAFLRRVIAGLLILFAVSGIFSFAMKPEDGGLVGRANYALFHGWLGRPGSFVINGLIIAVSIVLVLDFSVFQYVKDATSRTKEKQDLIMARRERRQLEREKDEIEDRENTVSEIEAERKKAEAYRKYIDEKQEQERRKRERFSNHYYGIGDTKIVDDGPAKKTVFMRSDEDEPEEETRFFDTSKGGTPDKPEEVPFVEGKDTKPREEGVIPKISFGEQFFKNDEDPDAFSADEQGDQYTKMVITKNGKVVPEEQAPAAAPRPAASLQGVFTAPANETEQNTDGTPHQMTINEVVEKNAKEYQFPPLKLLKRSTPSGSSRSDIQRELNENALKLKETFENFGIGITVTSISSGPSVTRYEIQQDIGVKVSKIVNLKDEIEQSLAASYIRIEAPIPGKSAIGIEIPNRTKTGVCLRDLLESDDYKESKSKLSYGLGRGIDGKAIISDIAKMPHLLVAGTTGSGKSVCLNTMIISVLYHAKPTEVKMIMIDPKMVEFAQYNGIPHLLLPVVTDPKKASMALGWAAAEMEKRYEAFAKYGVRSIDVYNQYIEMEQPEEAGVPVRPMPLILIFVDEFSDLMMAASKEVEANVVRLAQKARAAGIHLVLATQSPRATVLTGLIKANIPSRIALSVASELESRIIMDNPGAETLLGHGDMLYLPIGANKPVRVQGAYVSDDEIRDVVNWIKKAGPVKGGGINESVDLSKSPAEMQQGSGNGQGGPSNGRDELFNDVGRFVIEKQKASIGALQRQFSIGFNRAARIMDQLADAGVVGEEEGTKPRKILMNAVEFDELLKNG